VPIACPSCGTENPDGFKFCAQCATPLAAPPPISKERKVVTTLFCDLVAFTAMSEAADPEDVDRILGEYFARATEVIESHGGTVEKFIGDAVVGVFGVPAVHEDDPERAVRAGLRILEALDGMIRPDGSSLQARVGVNTGEALVRLDVDPASGRGFLTGDAVNTAARLEAAAPPGGVVVGILTHDLSTRAIAYEQLPAIAANGKTEPIPAWLATGRLARRGIEARVDLTSLVGREVELAYLNAVLDKAITQALPQLALIVGEPGIGKSRLVRELATLLDARTEMVTWRQGYCPPYGEEVACAALAEIVRGHAGIRDNDPLDVVETKLETILPEGPDQGWFRQRLRALLGLAAPGASLEENFTAWTRLLEGIAGAGPTVLVLEDLHWADEALLDFLEFLVTQVAAVPLLLVGTARPELFERKPGFMSAVPSTRVNLAPLSASDTAQLVAGLLGEPRDRAAAVGQVVERSEGNPFFAEQSARLLGDTSLHASLPGSVQAVIAARLDTLPSAEKRLLADASVVGDVFWQGALQALTDCSPQGLEQSLAGLLRHQLVRRLRESSMEGEQELTFVHTLAREVAYSQLPRADRAKKHVAVARWIEAQTGDGRAESSEVLAHHYTAALDLALAAGENELRESLLERAVHYLTEAGDRVRPLDLGAAERCYEQALRLAPIDHPRRPHLLHERGCMLRDVGRVPDAVDLLYEAAAAFEVAGDIRGLTLATDHLWGALDDMCDPRRAEVAAGFPDLLAQLEAEGPSPELVEALTDWGVYQGVLEGRRQVGIEAFEKAIEMAKELGLPTPAWALFERAAIRYTSGDDAALKDMDTAIAIAESLGLKEALYAMANRAALLSMWAGPAVAMAAFTEVRDLARRRGQQAVAWLADSNIAECLWWTGAWGEALAELEDLAAASTAGAHVYALYGKAEELIIRSQQGSAVLAEPYIEQVVAWGRGTDTAYMQVTHALLSSAVAFRQMGELETAHELLTEWATKPKAPDIGGAAAFLPDALRAALECGDLDLASGMTAGVQPGTPDLAHVLVTTDSLFAEADCQHQVALIGFADAAARWHDFGVPYEEAQALLGQGRCLVALGRARQAVQPLEQARDIFERLGAKPALVETEGWLAKTN
jgi:class 3 adenylate cyclase/tetratricopeptide (TPR) repeat protein